MKNILQHIDASGWFLILVTVFFGLYTEIKNKQEKIIPVVITSDAIFYHEYIAVHMYGMEPYIPREKKPVIKYTMGMAITYLPGVAIGYVGTELKGLNHDYGRNYFYQRVLYYMGFIYTLIGLFFLRRILKRWFDGYLIALVLAIIFFGTNLYYYIRVGPLMAHAPSFAFITAFVYYCLRLFDKPNLKSGLGAGIFLALLTLIRPTNLVICILPLVYLLAQKISWTERIQFIKTNIRIWLIIASCVVLAFIPQMVYWHHYTGKWFYYSYGHEKFFWTKPALLQVLFSFRKGWFVYTPVMLLIIPGFILCYQKNKALFWSILVFTLLNIYIISCWWCWWYGGSYGMRTMIDCYGIMAILIAFTLQFIWKKSKPIFVGLFCIIGFLGYLNLFQTRQARISWIHYDSMTFKAYKAVFLKDKMTFTGEEWRAMLDTPDYEKAFVGERQW